MFFVTVFSLYALVSSQMAANRPVRFRKKTKIHSHFLIFLMLLHYSYNKNAKMPNNKRYKLNIRTMSNSNEKRDYNTGVNDGAKKF